MTELSIQEIDKKIGERIRDIRNQCGISQEKLGEAIGVSFQQVQKYERGLNRVSCGKLAAIAQLCNTPISTFFHLEVNKLVPTEKQSLCMALARKASSLNKNHLHLVHNLVDGLSKGE